jgi:hypothetical protein
MCHTIFLNAIILDTVKGKGIPYLEENHIHGFDFNKNEALYKLTIDNLK